MSKFYVSKPTQDGILYFITPSKASKVSGLGGSKIKYDFTYLAPQDTVSLLLSLEHHAPTQITSIQLGLTSEHYPSEAIYVQHKGRKWQSRIRCLIPYKAWRTAMLSAEPLDFILWAGQAEYARYGLSVGQWRKRRSAYQVFYQLLDLNPPQ